MTNVCVLLFFFFNDTATTDIYTLSLHDALPIYGNCNTWYVAEMAEKRALSRAVLKLTGFYELGVFGEDESEDFKKVNKDKLINLNK